MFSKIFFGVWYARKNLERQKCYHHWNPATSGRRRRWIPGTCLAGSGQNGQILARLLRIRLDPAGSRPFWPDPTGSSLIRPDFDHFIQIRLTSDHGRILANFGRNLIHRHPATVVGSRRSLVPSVFRWLNVAGFRRRLDLAMGYQTCVQGLRV
jgi:hypothetical protein